MGFENIPDALQNRNTESTQEARMNPESPVENIRSSVRRARETSPSMERAKHFAGMTMKIMSVIAMLSSVEAQADTREESPLEQMDAATLLATPIDQIRHLLESRELRLPSETEAFAELSLSYRQGVGDISWKNGEINQDEMGVIGVVSSSRSIQRMRDVASQGKERIKEEDFVELNIRLVRPDKDLELMDTGIRIIKSSLGMSREEAIMVATSDIAISYRSHVFSETISNESLRDKTTDGKVQSSEVIDIGAVDAAEYLDHVRVVRVDKKVINGKTYFEAQVEGEIVLPIVSVEGS